MWTVNNINNNCSKKIIDVGYSVARLARDLDWVAVMTYDYHGHWDKKTGHVAPFYGHPDDDFYYFNTVGGFKFLFGIQTMINDLINYFSRITP